MRLAPRSALFLPASNQRAIDKARTLACDAMILDLEDAVAPEEKDAARERAVAAIATGGFAGRLVVVRVNAPETPAFERDLAALDGLRADAILVPKVGGPADLERVRERTPLPLWAMVETCAAILHLPAIAAAAAANGLEAMVAGTNDLAQEMRCRARSDRMPLLPALSQIVVAARAAGVVALDGVSNVLDDMNIVAEECRQGRYLGFDGKTLIHPSQIKPANEAFVPSEEELASAKRTIMAFADVSARDKGAIRIGAAMVERLHLADAERVLAAARRREQGNYID